MLYQISAVMYVTIDDHWFNVGLKLVLSAERTGQYIRITLDSGRTGRWSRASETHIGSCLRFSRYHPTVIGLLKGVIWIKLYQQIVLFWWLRFEQQFSGRTFLCDSWAQGYSHISLGWSEWDRCSCTMGRDRLGFGPRFRGLVLKDAIFCYVFRSVCRLFGPCCSLRLLALPCPGSSVSDIFIDSYCDHFQQHISTDYEVEQHAVQTWLLQHASRVVSFRPPHFLFEDVFFEFDQSFMIRPMMWNFFVGLVPVWYLRSYCFQHQAARYWIVFFLQKFKQQMC